MGNHDSYSDPVEGEEAKWALVGSASVSWPVSLRRFTNQASALPEVHDCKMGPLVKRGFVVVLVSDDVQTAPQALKLVPIINGHDGRPGVAPSEIDVPENHPA